MKRLPFTTDVALKLAAMGALAGVVNGLLGAGGGIITVIAVNKYLKDVADDKNGAFATALCVMLPISLLSCSLYAFKGHISLDGFGWFIPSALIGGALGGILLGRIRADWMKKIFSALVAISGVLLIIR